MVSITGVNKKTALQLKELKDKKYETKLEPLGNGNYILKWRGRNAEELRLHKESKALEKPKKKRA